MRVFNRVDDFYEAFPEITQPLVFTNGCFDILHVGHLAMLQEAKLHGFLVVGLNSDSSVKALKGDGRPVIPQQDRALLLAGLRCVDAVIIFDEETPLRLLYELEPDVLVKGGDYQEGDIIGGKYVRSYGGKVSTVQYVGGHSSTFYLNRLSQLTV